VLVPRTIIPVPEAREFMVMVEQKEASEIQAEKTASACTPLWSAVTDRFNAVPLKVEGRAFRVERNFRGSFLFLGKYRPIHYEFVVRARAKCLDVAVHFEAKDEAANEAAVSHLKSLAPTIAEGISEPLLIGNFGDANGRTKWRELRFRIHAPDPRSPSLAPRAVELMRALVERTYPTLTRACSDLV
jgi:hypothetical protein